MRVSLSINRITNGRHKLFTSDIDRKYDCLYLSSWKHLHIRFLRSRSMCIDPDSRADIYVIRGDKFFWFWIWHVSKLLIILFLSAVQATVFFSTIIFYSISKNLGNLYCLLGSEHAQSYSPTPSSSRFIALD